MTEPWYVRSYDEHYYEIFHDEFTPEQTRAEVDGIVARLGLSPGARVLDLCCGFGRHSLELARRGYQVTGLDLSPALLAPARTAAQEEGLEIAWIQADMRDIPSPVQPYDAVVNMFSAFGLLGDDAEEAKVVRAVARVLAPGGGLLIETVNREILIRRWNSLRWYEKPDGTLIMDKLRFDVSSGIMNSREIIVGPDGRRREDEHRIRLWSYTELAMLLRASGLAECQAFGDMGGSVYTWDSHRMVVTARRSTD